MLEVLVPSKRPRGQIKEPGADNAPGPPNLGDCVEVQLEILLRLHDGETLRVCLHQAVFNPVVYHLHEMPSPIWPDMAPALVRGWRQGLKDRAQALNHGRFAPAHEAVTFFESPDPAAGTDIHEVEPILPQHGRAPDRIPIVGVAAINHDVIS